jgi:hypothetical protein
MSFFVTDLQLHAPIRLCRSIPAPGSFKFPARNGLVNICPNLFDKRLSEKHFQKHFHNKWRFVEWAPGSCWRSRWRYGCRWEGGKHPGYGCVNEDNVIIAIFGVLANFRRKILKFCFYLNLASFWSLLTAVWNYSFKNWHLDSLEKHTKIGDYMSGIKSMSYSVALFTCP